MTTPPPTVSKTFELSISEGALASENIFFEVEAAAEVTPHVPEQVSTHSSEGQPAEGGYTTITHLNYTESLIVFPPPGHLRKIHDISWLIDILPTSLIESWQRILYAQYTERGE